MVGGLIYYLMHKTSSPDTFKSREEKGILYSSGMVAGDALIGVLIAFAVAIPVVENWWKNRVEGFWFWKSGAWSEIFPLVAFAAIGWSLWRFSKK